MDCEWKGYEHDTMIIYMIFYMSCFSSYYDQSTKIIRIWWSMCFDQDIAKWAPENDHDHDHFLLIIIFFYFVHDVFCGEKATNRSFE